jgi:hypothetical protein
MYVIDLVESRDSDQSVNKIRFEGSGLADAIAHARLSIENIELAVPSAPGWRSDVIGFIIYDDSGREV